MEFLVYYFTLVVLLAGVLAAASCFSVFLVSHRRIMLLACFGFLCAFFDTAFMLQDDIAVALFGVNVDTAYLLGRSVVTTFIGGACLTFFWLAVCDFLQEHHRVLLVAPSVIFFIACFAMLPFSEDNLVRFWFYTTRAIYIIWMLLFAVGRYLATSDPIERCRWRRAWPLLAIASVLVVGIIAEDVTFFLILKVDTLQLGPLALNAERNYCENLLTMACAAFACLYAFRSLSLRFHAPPADEDDDRERYIDDNLLSYGKRFGLTDREREVLRLILRGKDNQNIASTLSIALSTAKVYVHRILQKTGQPNRQALVQDFWRTA